MKVNVPTYKNANEINSQAIRQSRPEQIKRVASQHGSKLVLPGRDFRIQHGTLFESG
jgi:hypothetical protein